MQHKVQELRDRVGKNVKRLRESRGWSQAKLAELVENTDKHIGQIERGQVNLGLNTLAKLAFRFNVSVSELVGDPDGRRAHRKRALSKEEHLTFDEAFRMLETFRDAIGPPRGRSR